MSVMNQAQELGGSLRTFTLCHSQGVGVVFGLDWMPLVGGLPERMGYRRARAVRASHFLVTGSPTSVVGCGVIRYASRTHQSKHPQKMSVLYSAAALFAAAHPNGVIAAVYFLEQKGFWMVGVNMGVVLAQTDRWFATLSEVETVLASLVSRFPSMRVLALLNFDESTLPDWAAALAPHARLQRVPVLSTFLLRTGLCVAVLGGSIWLWEFTRATPLPQQPVLDAAAQWEDSMQKFLNRHPVHSIENLLTVVHAWYRAPVHSGGWGLNQIICDSLGVDWQCAARYQRRHNRALNRQLDAVKPEGWTLEVTDLDHAVMTWAVKGAAQPFQPVSPTIPIKQWMGHLQSVTPVFESIQVGSGSTLILPTPLDQQGMPMSRPAQVKSFKRRSINIKGPMRSISALYGLAIPVRWRSIHLSLGQPQGQGVNQSELMVQLQGEIFEISE